MAFEGNQKKSTPLGITFSGSSSRLPEQARGSLCLSWDQHSWAPTFQWLNAVLSFNGRLELFTEYGQIDSTLRSFVCSWFLFGAGGEIDWVTT